MVMVGKQVKKEVHIDANLTSKSPKILRSGP